MNDSHLLFSLSLPPDLYPYVSTYTCSLSALYSIRLSSRFQPISIPSLDVSLPVLSPLFSLSLFFFFSFSPSLWNLHVIFSCHGCPSIPPSSVVLVNGILNRSVSELQTRVEETSRIVGPMIDADNESTP